MTEPKFPPMPQQLSDDDDFTPEQLSSIDGSIVFATAANLDKALSRVAELERDLGRRTIQRDQAMGHASTALARVAELEAALRTVVDRMPHHGSCCTFEDGRLTVTEASCVCEPHEKAARAALTPTPSVCTSTPPCQCSEVEQGKVYFCGVHDVPNDKGEYPPSQRSETARPTDPPWIRAPDVWNAAVEQAAALIDARADKGMTTDPATLARMIRDTRTPTGSEGKDV